MAAVELNERADRPAYVRFERRPMEDKPATLRAGTGTVVYKDVDFVKITPPYSKDVIEQKVTQWLLDMEMNVRNDRMPREWMDRYVAAHKAWLNGQEMPLHGTAIRGWGVVSPAQQETLIRMNILTVEDLAAVNDEGIRRIGMGGTELKHKAKAWISQHLDKGPLTLENAALKTQVSNLESQLAQLTQSVQQLQRQSGQPLGNDDGDSLVPEIPEVRRGPGRPRKDAA